MPRRSSSDSSSTLPPREAPLKTAPLSLSSAAGRPCALAAAKKTSTTSAAFTVRKATEDAPDRRQRVDLRDAAREVVRDRVRASVMAGRRELAAQPQDRALDLR